MRKKMVNKKVIVVIWVLIIAVLLWTTVPELINWSERSGDDLVVKSGFTEETLQKLFPSNGEISDNAEKVLVQDSSAVVTSGEPEGILTLAPAFDEGDRRQMQKSVSRLDKTYNVVEKRSDGTEGSVIINEAITLIKNDLALNVADEYFQNSLDSDNTIIEMETIGEKSRMYKYNVEGWGEYYRLEFIKKDVFVDLWCYPSFGGCPNMLIEEGKRIVSLI